MSETAGSRHLWIRISEISWRRVGLGSIISIVAVVALARSFNFSEVVAGLLAINPTSVLAILAVYAIGLVLKAERWRVLLGTTCRASRARLIEALIIGFALNAVLPAKAGELGRIVLIGERGSTSRGWVALSLVGERVIDLAVVAAMLAATTLAVTVPPWIVRPTVLSFIIVVVFIGSLVVLTHSQNRFLATFRALLVAVLRRVSTSPRLERWGVRDEIDQLGPAVRHLTKVLTVLKATALSLAVWAASWGFIALTLQASGVSVSVAAAILLAGALSIGLAAPGAPAGIGVYQWIVVIVLGIFGVSTNQALTAGIAAHVLSYVPVTLLGLLLLTRRGTLARQIRIVTTSDEPAAGLEADVQ